MSATDKLNSEETSALPTALVLGSLLAAVIATVVTGSVQESGSLAALSNPAVGFDLFIGSVGVVLLLPLIHIGIASVWKSYRNIRTRKKIVFGWGVAVTVIQLLILLSEIAA